MQTRGSTLGMSPHKASIPDAQSGGAVTPKESTPTKEKATDTVTQPKLKKINAASRNSIEINS